MKSTDVVCRGTVFCVFEGEQTTRADESWPALRLLLLSASSHYPIPHIITPLCFLFQALLNNIKSPRREEESSKLLLHTLDLGNKKKGLRGGDGKAVPYLVGDPIDGVT